MGGGRRISRLRSPGLTPEQLTQLRAELDQLREFRQLAASIIKNSKGEVLLTALRRGFAAAAKAQEKEEHQASAEGRHIHGIAPHPGVSVPRP